MTQRPMVHYTAPANLPSVVAHGLWARDTTLHNYPTAKPNGGIPAVYCYPLDAVHPTVWHFGQVTFDAVGLPVEPDPALNLSRSPCRAQRVLADVGPDRILAAERIEL